MEDYVMLYRRIRVDEICTLKIIGPINDFRFGCITIVYWYNSKISL